VRSAVHGSKGAGRQDVCSQESITRPEIEHCYYNYSMKQNSRIYEWYQLVSEARTHLGCALDDNVESYLILTLDHYTSDIQLPDQILAIDFLEGFYYKGREAIDRLRRTGDRCLILAGFFPDRAQRFNLKSEYFIELGQQAYHTLAGRSILQYDPLLFDALCREFVTLTQVLLTMRQARQITPFGNDFCH